MAGSADHKIAIFTEALRFQHRERAAYLERACGSDVELRRAVEALLQEHDHVGDFLEDSPNAARTKAKAAVAGAEKAGDYIGGYKLLQQIGEGGWGVVFMAEKDEPVRRKVALKVVKPGMDTKSVIARFEAERQALALMDHPNIAQVLDAGATENGRPYFVMELVRGSKITDYCDQNRVPTAGRLELFIQVCNAVQHAHQKGVIHRDLKPSNILVTTSEEGKPLPKVIDFGIAKATAGLRLTDKTLFTGFEMLIGTPAYMSPEQAALTSVDVDTRSDIYSLGVLLYELLTSTTPFDTHELLKAGLDEIRRVIQTEEPVRPSTRLSTMVAANLTNISRQRQADGPKLIHDVRGDLDWIVMKTLEKDRTRRYQTANSLGEDVQHYLANETVSARPPSVAYKFQKLIARNKLGFAAFGIVLATLLAGLAVTTWSLSKEKHAHHEADLARIYANEQREKAILGEQKALTAATRSREVTEFLKQMIFGAHPIIANGRDTSIAREILDKTVAHLDVELTNQPAVQADMKLWIGGLYIALEKKEVAETLLGDALAYYRKFPKGSEREISDALYRLSLLHFTARPPELGLAEKEVREALNIETNLTGKPTMQVMLLEVRLGLIRLFLGHPAEAEKIFRKALAEARPLSEIAPERLLDARSGLATALSAQRKYEEAEALLRESISIARKKYGLEHPLVANDMARLAEVLERGNKLDDAEELYRKALAIRRKTLDEDHSLIEETLAALARVLGKEEKSPDTADAYRDLLNVRRKKYGDQDALVLKTAMALAGILVVDRRQAQFEELAGEFPGTWAVQSEDSARRGRWAEALAAASRLVEVHPDDHKGFHLMAPLLVQMQDRHAYEELCSKIIKRFASARDPYTADSMAKDCLILPWPGAEFRLLGELAETAVTKGKKDTEALPLFQCCKALAEYRQGHFDDAVKWSQLASTNPFPYSQAEAFAILAMSQYQLKQVNDAKDSLAKCGKVVETQLPKLEAGDLGEDWRDWIIAHALLTEAQELLGAPAAGVNSPNPTNK